MQTEETIRKMLSDLESLQSTGKRNPPRMSKIKTLKWVLGINEEFK